MKTRSNRDTLPSSADTRPWSLCWHQDLGSHLSLWMVNRDVEARSIAEGRQGHWDALSCWLKRREAPGGILQIKVSPKPRSEPPKLEKPCHSLHLPPFRLRVRHPKVLCQGSSVINQTWTRPPVTPASHWLCPDVFLLESDEGLRSWTAGQTAFFGDDCWYNDSCWCKRGSSIFQLKTLDWG